MRRGSLPRALPPDPVWPCLGSGAPALEEQDKKEACGRDDVGELTRGERIEEETCHGSDVGRNVEGGGKVEPIVPVAQPLLWQQICVLTPVEVDPSEAEPYASISTAPLWEEVQGPEMVQQRRKRRVDNEDSYEKLLKIEIKRAVIQILLAEKQLKLIVLQQQETRLKIQLLEKKFASDSGL
eukprot:superscaffoldBa00005428_g20329